GRRMSAPDSTAPPPPARLPLSRGRRVRRFILRRLIWYPLIYVGVVAVLLLLERSLVFHPSSPAGSGFAPEDKRTQDVWLADEQGTKLHAWWLPPETPEAGAVLVAHGNGGNVSHRGALAADLRRTLGAGVLIFDYPGYGKSEGKPTEAGCYAAG